MTYKLKCTESECSNEAAASDTLCLVCRSAVDTGQRALEKLKRFTREHMQFPNGEGKPN